MLKFRSMVVNAENLGTGLFSYDNDPRVTKVGAFLRKTSIDEFPQFFNVLIGNMSFIGPRASGAGALDNYLADEKDKMKVLPGITGYTQAYYRNGLSVREKRLKDAWYANNVTISLDVRILLKSFITVFKRENVYTNEAGTEKENLWIDVGE